MEGFVVVGIDPIAEGIDDFLGHVEIQPPIDEYRAQQGFVLVDDEVVDVETSAFGNHPDFVAFAGFLVHVSQHRVGAFDDGIGADGDTHFRHLAGA